MILPVIIITFVLSFPLSNGLYSGGQTMEGGFYGYKSLVTCSYKSDSTFYNSDSLSDNLPDDSNGDTSFQGVTGEQFAEFDGNFREYLSRVEAHNIEIKATQDKILELIIYISGFLLFFLLIDLLKYIYKFFKMFF